MARFLFVISGLGPGGSERQLAFLTEALHAAGHDVMVMVWNYMETEVYVERIRAAGGTIIPASGGSVAGKWRHLRRLVRAERPDVVHSYSYYLNAVVAAAAAGSGAMAVGSVRSMLGLALHETGPLLGRASARWPRRQIYNNGSAAADAAARRWWRPRQVIVVPNHIDVESFPETPVPDGTPEIAAIGSLLPIKDWPRLLALAARLRREGVPFRVSLAGEGPLRASLEEEIARLDLGGHVTLLGHVADVKALLGRASLLVHVSSSEGSPNVVIEALAAGRAVVATAVGDVPRLVKDGKTGFVVPPGDDEQLFARAALLLRDRELRVRMGREARRAAREQFGTAALADEVLQAYRQLGWRN